MKIVDFSGRNVRGRLEDIAERRQARIRAERVPPPQLIDT
jgi:hypothetical protein